MTCGQLTRGISFLASLLVLANNGRGSEPTFNRTEDVVYGRKYGTALTMDVFTPIKGAKAIGVIIVVSGGFVSAHDAISPIFIQPLIDRGYTIFTVLHGSQPRYTVPEIIQDMNRAVRFIRYHASDYYIDPDSIGVSGASADGHLALMLATAGDKGDLAAKDPIDRVSSRVQAVACFFTPTDFLNYGKTGNAKIHARDHAPPYRAAFDYRELDQESKLWVPITDPSALRISPAGFHPFIMSRRMIHQHL